MLTLVKTHRPNLRMAMPSLSAETAVALMVVLGLSLRLFHFLRIPSLWHDEAVLLLAVANLEFSQMFGPLPHHEAAPPLFLVLERCMYLLFNESLLMLRLPPFLASCLTLVLFAKVSLQVLTRSGAVWAVALFAVAERMIYHSFEAKPYAIDVLVAQLMLVGYLKTRYWPLWKQCLAALPIMPVVLWLSFPSSFVIGGWFVAQLPVLFRSRCSRDWICSIGLAAAVAASFLALALGPIAAQHDDAIRDCWTASFPDWQRPWTIPFWSLRRTFNIVSFCLSPMGGIFLGVIGVGAVAMARRSGRDLLIVMLVPLALAYLAALLLKYPYNGLRVLAYMTPAITLLAAAGIEPVTVWLRRRHRLAVLLLWIALVWPFFNTARQLVYPWQRSDSSSCNAYVLEHWQPGDRVGFNSWESEYEFRHISAAWSNGEPAPGRLWYVVVAPDRTERERLIRDFAPTWQQMERHDFTGAAAVLYVPRSDSTSTAGLIP